MALRAQLRPPMALAILRILFAARLVCGMQAPSNRPLAATVRMAPATNQVLLPTIGMPLKKGKSEAVLWLSAGELGKDMCLATTRREAFIVGLFTLPALAKWLFEIDNRTCFGLLALCATFAVAVSTLSTKRLDPGSAASCKAWLDCDERGVVLYDCDGVSVTEVDASDELGGRWRCLRTSKGRIVQSAVRVVEGSVHPGALAGYMSLVITFVSRPPQLHTCIGGRCAGSDAQAN